jgi:TPR repeat protein
MEGGFGTAKDEKKAFDLFTLAATHGLRDAQFKLGTMYTRGGGCTKDVKKAFEWYQKAAVQGFRDAQNKLGRCYVRCCWWWCCCCLMSELIVCCVLCCGVGECYLSSGMGAPRDNKKSFEWYLAAAEQDSRWGQFKVGKCDSETKRHAG